MNEALRQAASEALSKVMKLRHGDTLQFVFVTDPHHRPGGCQLAAAEAIRELAERAGLAFIACGGDMSVNGDKAIVARAQREILDALTVPECPLLPVKGNHDDNTIHDYNQHPDESGHVISPEETYKLWYEGRDNGLRFDPDHPLGLYYFFDIEAQSTRVIVLNTIDIPYRTKDAGGMVYNGQWTYAFSARQLNWMAHTALRFDDKVQPEQWRVIVISHVAVVQEDVRGTDHPVRNGEAMWGVMRAFQHGADYRSHDADHEFGYSVDVSYSGECQGRLLAAMFGHVHCDQTLERDGIRLISVLNAAAMQDTADCPERREGDVTETAFDVVTVDFNRSRMFFTRIGAGEDRSVDIGSGIR